MADGLQLTDAALVLACRQGDAKAWETLVTRYQRLIYTIPRRAGLDEDLAAEVFQRTFAKLVEKLDGLEHPERLRAWLVTTARRESWRVSQRQRATEPLPGSDEDDDRELVDEALLPDEMMTRMEAQHTVRLALESLEERCRRLLILLFYRPDAPAYTDIAAALGMTIGSVGPTRARCLEKLKRILEEWGQ